MVDVEMSVNGSELTSTSKTPTGKDEGQALQGDHRPQIPHLKNERVGLGISKVPFVFFQPFYKN